jgi:hypothetical protein
MADLPHFESSSTSTGPQDGPWHRGMTRYHWFVLIVAALGWLFDCLDQQLFNLARKPAMQTLLATADGANEVRLWDAGRGEGRAPKLSNYVIPSSHLPQPLLPFVADEFDPLATDRNLNQLRSVLFASAAFPVAFAPQPIEYCLSKPPRDGETATAKNVECLVPEYLDLFNDGGVYDNHPLRLAYPVAENRLQHAHEKAMRGGIESTNDSPVDDPNTAIAQQHEISRVRVTVEGPPLYGHGEETTNELVDEWRGVDPQILGLRKIIDGESVQEFHGQNILR